MTLPTLIQKHKEQETVAKVKKFYSAISQAVMLARAEHGDIDTWTLETNSYEDETKSFANYIMPHLKIIKDCGVDNDKECIPVEKMKYLNNTEHSTDYATNRRYYKIILNDGSLIMFRSNGEGCNKPAAYAKVENVCALFWLDVNGKKAPYTYGKDVFLFFVTKNAVVTQTIDDCNLNSEGYSCANYILLHNDMGYLH